MTAASVSIARIKQIVAADFDVPEAELVSHRRFKEFIEPRHVAIYLACGLTPHSSGTIGRHFGGRDHSTICHAHHRIADMRAADRDFDQRLLRLEQALEPPRTLAQEIQLSFLIGPLFDRNHGRPRPTLTMLEAA